MKEQGEITHEQEGKKNRQGLCGLPYGLHVQENHWKRFSMRVETDKNNGSSMGANEYDFIWLYPNSDQKFSKYDKDFVTKSNMDMDIASLISF